MDYSAPKCSLKAHQQQQNNMTAHKVGAKDTRRHLAQAQLVSRLKILQASASLLCDLVNRGGTLQGLQPVKL